MSYAPATDAYLKLGTRVGTGLANLRFNTFPVRYIVTNRDVPGVTAVQLQQAVDHALASWAAVPNVSLSSQFVGFTAANPLSGDNANVLGFASRPDLDRVLGSTSFTVDTVSGRSSSPTSSSTRRSPGRSRPRAKRGGRISNRSRCTSSGTCTGSGIPCWVKRS